jgi:hypothetical protein
VSTPGERIRHGQVWVSRDEVMGPMNYLVVSSDADNAAFGDRRVIAVEVDSRALYEGTYREPIVDAGSHARPAGVGGVQPRYGQKPPSAA